MLGGGHRVWWYFGNGTSEYLGDTLLERWEQKKGPNGYCEFGWVWLHYERR